MSLLWFNEGVFVTFIGIQYYTWEGEPNGYSIDIVNEINLLNV